MRATATPATAGAGDRFIALVHTPKFQNLGQLAHYDNQTLLKVGRQECRDFSKLRTSSSRSMAISDLVRVNWEAVSAAALVNAASKTLC